MYLIVSGLCILNIFMKCILCIRIARMHMCGLKVSHKANPWLFTNPNQKLYSIFQPLRVSLFTHAPFEPHTPRDNHYPLFWVIHSFVFFMVLSPMHVSLNEMFNFLKNQQQAHTIV